MKMVHAETNHCSTQRIQAGTGAPDFCRKHGISDARAEAAGVSSIQDFFRSLLVVLAATLQ